MSEEPLDDLVWLTPLRPQRGLLEPWLRRAAVAPDGLVFVPAALAGNEMMVHLAAAWENDVPTIYDDAGHAYVPSHWLAETFPSVAGLCQLIERRCFEQMAPTPEPTTSADVRSANRSHEPHHGPPRPGTTRCRCS